jgi:hypothetical protein
MTCPPQDTWSTNEDPTSDDLLSESQFMALRLGKFDKKVWVYGEKWHSIVLTSLAILACTVVASTFVSLAIHQTAFWFFGAVFGAVGVALLVRLPTYVRQVFLDNGAMLLGADETGLTIARSFHGIVSTYHWSSVSEIVLSKKLRLVDAAETTHIRHGLIVFFNSGELKEISWIERVKLGLAKTSNGRHYYLTAYPPNEHYALLDALRKVAPATLPMKFETRLRFVTLTRDLTEPLEH